MGAVVELLQELRKAVFAIRMRHAMQRRLSALRTQYRQLPKVSAVAGTARTLTIVVPCYGHSQFLRTTVKSIAAQTLPPNEVVFVNDCSPDSTLEIIESSIAEFGLRTRTRCLVLNNVQNLGQAASLNAGIAAATSDVTMVVNDDDYLFHDAVAITMAILQLRPHIRMLGGQCILFEDERSLALYNKELLKIWNIDEMPMKEFHPMDTMRYKKSNDLNITHSGCSFYKESWRDVDGYCVDKGARVIPFSDRDFQLRFNLLFPIAILDAPISFWRSNSSVDAGLNS